MDQEIFSQNEIGPKEIRNLGVSHVPEDRQSRGIVLPISKQGK